MANEEFKVDVNRVVSNPHEYNTWFVIRNAVTGEEDCLVRVAPREKALDAQLRADRICKLLNLGVAAEPTDEED